MLKRLTAILFLFIYTFGATDACQLLKLPLLIGHYIKHKAENPGTTLAGFFKMHYVDPQARDADYAQDMQLPFKRMPDAFFRHTASLVYFDPVVKLKAPQANIDFPPVFNENVGTSLYINNIFQPPRV